MVSRLIGTDNSQISALYEHEHQQSNERMYESKVDELAFLLLSNLDLSPTSKLLPEESEKFKDLSRSCHRLWKIGDRLTNIHEQSKSYSLPEMIQDQEKTLSKSEKRLEKMLELSLQIFFIFIYHFFRAKAIRKAFTKNKVNVLDKISVGEEGHLIIDRKFAKGESQTDTDIDVSFLNSDSKFTNSQADHMIVQLRAPNIDGSKKQSSFLSVEPPSPMIDHLEHNSQYSLEELCSKLFGIPIPDEKYPRKIRGSRELKFENEDAHFGSQVKVAKNGLLEDFGLLATNQAQLSEFSQDFNGEDHNSFAKSDVSLTRVAVSVSPSIK